MPLIDPRDKIKKRPFWNYRDTLLRQVLTEQFRAFASREYSSKAELIGRYLLSAQNALLHAKPLFPGSGDVAAAPKICINLKNLCFMKKTIYEEGNHNCCGDSCTVDFEGLLERAEKKTDDSANANPTRAWFFCVCGIDVCGMWNRYNVIYLEVLGTVCPGTGTILDECKKGTRAGSGLRR